MGKNFNVMVELVKKELEGKEQSRKGIHKDSHIPNIMGYLERLIRRAALFEFPLNAEEIFPRSGKDDKEYNAYLIDYFDISKENGHVLATPFPITAIEDNDSVVFLEKVAGDTYRVISCREEQLNREMPIIATTLQIGEVSIKEPSYNGGFLLPVVPLYNANWMDGIRMPDILNSPGGIHELRKDLINDAISYIEQVIYIMDPANFIIEKESNASKKQKAKSSKKKNRYNPLRKTVMRPHYVCLSEEDTKGFLQDESKELRPFHPVIGHWKTLISDRYVNKKGQRILIAQYFRGKADIEGRNGWNYRVMLKEEPTKIIAYKGK